MLDDDAYLYLYVYIYIYIFAGLNAPVKYLIKARASAGGVFMNDKLGVARAEQRAAPHVCESLCECVRARRERIKRELV